MTDENSDFHLVWTSYANHYKQTLIEMMVLDKYTDVTLVCDDMVHVKSHRAILGACSKMFRNVFDSADIGSNIFLYLKGTKSHHLKSILQFIYEGEVSVTPEDLSDFLQIATDLNMTDIIKYIEEGKHLVNINEERNEKQLESFVMKEDLEVEMEENSEESHNVYGEHLECNECDEVLENKLALLDHQKFAHNKQLQENENKGENPLKCNECDAKFIEKYSLKVHVKSLHSNIKTYECDDCVYIAQTRVKLMKHIKRTHKFLCHECDANFTKKCSLKVHVESIHLNIIYECDQCNYTTKTKTLLREHTQKNHFGRTFGCNICEYGVRTKQALRHHIDSIHKGIKFYCSECDYEGTSHKYLKSHYVRYHPNNKINLNT